MFLSVFEDGFGDDGRVRELAVHPEDLGQFVLADVLEDLGAGAVFGGVAHVQGAVVHVGKAPVGVLQLEAVITEVC